MKTTLSWRDVEEREDVDLDLLLRWQVNPRQLLKLQPDVTKWATQAGARPRHAKDMAVWHPIRDLGGDLGDVMSLRASSKQLKTMGVTYQDLKAVGLKPETMPLMGLSFQGWVDLGLGIADIDNDFTDAQLGRVFMLTRAAARSCFKS